MPVITVEMWDGRTVDQKKLLVEGITSTFVKVGIPAKPSMSSFMMFPSIIGEAAVSWLQRLKRRKHGKQLS